MNIEQLKQLFREEYRSIADKFFVYDFSIQEARDSQAEHVWKPGVYVFWHPSEEVIKVGRHFKNSRKRALEHIRDDTGAAMADLANEPDTRLLLFNVLNPNDRHWVASLEVFFEEHLDPMVKSKRLG